MEYMNAAMAMQVCSYLYLLIQTNSSIDSMHQIIALQLHTEKFVVGVTLSTNQRYVTVINLQYSLYLHVLITHKYWVLCTMATGCYSNWAPT